MESLKQARVLREQIENLSPNNAHDKGGFAAEVAFVRGFEQAKRRILGLVWLASGRGPNRILDLAPEMAEVIKRVTDEARRGVDGPGMASDEAVEALHAVADKLRAIDEGTYA